MAMSKSLMILLGVLGLVAVGAIAFAGEDAGDVAVSGRMQNPDTEAIADWKITKKEKAAHRAGVTTTVYFAHFQISGGSLMTLSDAEDKPVEYESMEEARTEVLSSLAEQGFTVAVAEEAGVVLGQPTTIVQ